MNSVNIIEQVTEVTANSVNIALVIILIAIGYMLKNKMPKVKNSDIPIYLMIAGIVLSILLEFPFKTVDTPINIIVRGIASAFAASIVYDKVKDVIEGRKVNGPGDSDQSNSEESDTK